MVTKLDPTPPSRMQVESMAYALYIEDKHVDQRKGRDTTTWLDLTPKQRLSYRKQAVKLLEEQFQ